LVRYFIKTQELFKLTEEVASGTFESPPPNPRLNKFWSRLAGTEYREARKRSLNKGRTFLLRYKFSLDKHNEHFATPDLLFLASFGEAATGRMVARLLVGEATFADPPDAANITFVLPVHERTIDLVAFRCFLWDKCAVHSMAAAQTDNCKLVAAAVQLIADGHNIWDGSKNHSDHRDFNMLHFGSLPSTPEMVERAVKKARLCQRMGKGERNVTGNLWCQDTRRNWLPNACNNKPTQQQKGMKLAAKQITKQTLSVALC
jgi:hypothetical protein